MANDLSVRAKGAELWLRREAADNISATMMMLVSTLQPIFIKSTMTMVVALLLVVRVDDDDDHNDGDGDADNDSLQPASCPHSSPSNATSPSAACCSLLFPNRK